MRMGIVLGASQLASKRHLDAATEQNLVEQCRRRNLEAFGRIVDAYQSRVHGFVRRMVPDHEEALDVTQEVFVKAFQGFERFDGRSSLRTWLFRIAYNLSVDRSRRRQRQEPEVRLDAFAGEEEAIEVPDVRWNPEAIVIDDELRSIISDAVDGLSDKLRTVLLLHDAEDLAYEEIAEMVQIPVGTVKSRLFLARSTLQSAVRAYMGSRT